MMATKELHINIEHKIRLELEIASMKELVLGLMKEKKGSYETMHRNYTISTIFAITPIAVYSSNPSIKCGSAWKIF
jgi:hypothetical protein